MLEIVTLILFITLLIGCISTNISIIYALLGGLILFSGYTLYCKYTVQNLLDMMIMGIKNIRALLLVFTLIGCLTALWRASGTIPYIVCWSASLIQPRFYLLLTFLLCCGMSALTGTSFGTVSTMGVICASIGRALEVPEIYIGGAVMSGIYFGDQCSPMSSTALLISKLTDTDIYTNVGKLFKIAIVPIFVSGLLYFYLGNGLELLVVEPDMTKLFEQAFELHWTMALPAVMIVVLAIFRIKVTIVMAMSIVVAIGLCLFKQNMSLLDILNVMWNGYETEVLELSRLIDGGGLISMLRTTMIVGISSTYFGIFSETELLTNLKLGVSKLSKKSNIFVTTIVIAIITCAISCNQTLAIMLTGEMTKDLVPDKETLAVNLGTSVITIAGLMPWSIASAFPLSVIEVPKGSLLYASYLYLVPCWMLVCTQIKNLKTRTTTTG